MDEKHGNTDGSLVRFRHLSDWEYGSVAVGINTPAFQKNPGRFRIKTVGVSKSPVTTMGGVAILPSSILDDVVPSQSAMLILPGGMTWDEGKSFEAVEKVREFLAAGVPVAAICGATAGLARSGILDTRRHTSNSLDYLKTTHYRGELLYENQPAVTDKKMITAGGISPLEFAHHIFRKLDV
jgi:putative intracellular protease/amidase